MRNNDNKAKIREHGSNTCERELTRVLQTGEQVIINKFRDIEEKLQNDK